VSAFKDNADIPEKVRQRPLLTRRLGSLKSRHYVRFDIGANRIRRGVELLKYVARNAATTVLAEPPVALLGRDSALVFPPNHHQQSLHSAIGASPE
jgi:hypothetical protein